VHVYCFCIDVYHITYLEESGGTMFSFDAHSETLYLQFNYVNIICLHMKYDSIGQTNIKTNTTHCVTTCNYVQFKV